jgi:hypothetical protein
VIAIDPILDTADRVSWGWVAALDGLDMGGWLDPTAAARLTGVPAATLREWAEKGVISCLQDKRRKHRRYFEQELVMVMSVIGSAPRPTLALIRGYMGRRVKLSSTGHSGGCPVVSSRRA